MNNLLTNILTLIHASTLIYWKISLEREGEKKVFILFFENTSLITNTVMQALTAFLSKRYFLF